MGWIFGIPFIALAALVAVGNWQCMIRGGSLIPLLGFGWLVGALFMPALWRICLVGFALDPATWMLMALAVIYGIAPAVRWIVERARSAVPESPP